MASSTVVITEVAGQIWKITAAVGQQLTANDTIVLLECMKMEIPVCLARPCTVLEIYVTEGDLVERGDAIARVTF